MARLFNGTSDKVALPAVQYLAADSSVTIHFWNKVTTAQVQEASAFGIGGLANPNRCQAHAPFSDSTFYWDYGNSLGGGRVSFSYTPYLDAWRSVACGFNAATDLHAVYVDGAVAASNTNANSPTSALTGGNIGHATVDPLVYWHEGTMAEFAIWSAALTLSQIKALAAGANPFYVAPQSLVGYWPLFGDSPEPDYSRNRNSGTVTGSTAVAHSPVMAGLIVPASPPADPPPEFTGGVPAGVFDPQLVPKGWF